jgi:hypothetical protein
MQQSSPTTLSRIRVGIASRQHSPEFVDPMIERLLTQFERQSYTTLLQSDIVSGQHQTVLQSHHNCILSDRFRQAMRRINHSVHLPAKPWALRAGYLQLREYQAHLPRFFSFNELLVLFDGSQFRAGTLTDHWKQLIVIGPAANSRSRKTSVEGFLQIMFERRQFLEIIQHCIRFQKRHNTLTKSLRSHTFSHLFLSSF